MPTLDVCFTWDETSISDATKLEVSDGREARLIADGAALDLCQGYDETNKRVIDQGADGLGIIPNGGIASYTVTDPFGGSDGVLSNTLNTPIYVEQKDTGANHPFSMSNSPWTYEVWVYPTTLGVAVYRIFAIGYVGMTSYLFFGFGQNAGWPAPGNTNLVMGISRRYASVSSELNNGQSLDALLLLNTWNHLAWCSDGTTLYHWLNGNDVGQKNVAGIFFDVDVSAIPGGIPAILGARMSTSGITYTESIKGYHTGHVLTLGTAKYTSGFTKPTVPYPLYKTGSPTITTQTLSFDSAQTFTRDSIKIYAKKQDGSAISASDIEMKLILDGTPEAAFLGVSNAGEDTNTWHIDDADEVSATTVAVQVKLVNDGSYTPLALEPYFDDTAFSFTSDCLITSMQENYRTDWDLANTPGSETPYLTRTDFTLMTIKTFNGAETNNGSDFAQDYLTGGAGTKKFGFFLDAAAVGKFTTLRYVTTATCFQTNGTPSQFDDGTASAYSTAPFVYRTARVDANSKVQTELRYTSTAGAVGDDGFGLMMRSGTAAIMVARVGDNVRVILFRAGVRVLAYDASHPTYKAFNILYDESTVPPTIKCYAGATTGSNLLYQEQNVGWTGLIDWQAGYIIQSPTGNANFLGVFSIHRFDLYSLNSSSGYWWTQPYILTETIDFQLAASVPLNKIKLQIFRSDGGAIDPTADVLARLVLDGSAVGQNLRALSNADEAHSSIYHIDSTDSVSCNTLQLQVQLSTGAEESPPDYSWTPQVYRMWVDDYQLQLTSAIALQIFEDWDAATASPSGDIEVYQGTKAQLVATAGVYPATGQLTTNQILAETEITTTRDKIFMQIYRTDSAAVESGDVQVKLIVDGATDSAWYDVSNAGTDDDTIYKIDSTDSISFNTLKIIVKLAGDTTYSPTVYRPEVTGASIAPDACPDEGDVRAGVQYNNGTSVGTLVPFAVTPAAGNDIREQIMDVIETRLNTILTANNYKTDIVSVRRWSGDAVSRDLLPAIELYDPDNTATNDTLGSENDLLTVSMDFFATTEAAIRDLRADIIKCIFADVTHSNLANDTRLPSDRWSIEPAGEVTFMATITFDVDYNTDRGDPYN